MNFLTSYESFETPIFEYQSDHYANKPLHVGKPVATVNAKPEAQPDKDKLHQFTNGLNLLADQCRNFGSSDTLKSVTHKYKDIIDVMNNPSKEELSYYQRYGYPEQVYRHL
jgi:hypothetical protein